MKTILKHVKFKSKQLVALFFLILLSAFGQMLLPALLSKMISLGVVTGENRTIWMFAAIMAGVAVFSCLISFGSVKIASGISTGFAAQLRDKVFSTVQSFSAADLDQFGTASLITRSTSDITNVQNFLTLLLRVGLLAPMMAIAGLIFSASTGGKVSFVLLFAIPVLLIVLTIIMIFASRYSIRLRRKLDHINHLFLETLEGVRVIRAFNKQKTECTRFENSNEDYAMTAMTAGRITSILMPAISVIFGVTTAAVLGVGSYYVELGAMEVGSLVANSQYISMVLTSVMMLSIHLNVLPGQKVAIVGPTGAGKTTLINLLMRFYEVNSGSILVDGVKTSDMTREELRNRFGMVLQDTWLFEGTIRDNIGYAEDDMPMERIVASAKSACAHNFIKTLPGGYEMMLSKGAENLSQGERQLLTIARALASDPEIMILDEATSNVDTHTELLIQRAMAELMKGRTSFVIAHRLSTIRDADMILYMEDGDIKEVGTHEELIKKQGKYANLYFSQFE